MESILSPEGVAGGSMPQIQTITEKIDPPKLGITYCHEHLLFTPPEPFRSQDPDLAMDSLEAAVQEANTFIQAGGRTIVEMSTVDLQRAAENMVAVSKQTGVQIIAATGFNKAKFSEAVLADQSVEQIAAGMIHDLTIGMDGTEHKAGLIKAASSLNMMTPGEEKAFQAAIQAHLATGAPISTHTEAGTLALEQVRMLTGGGVKPNRILIGHLDRKIEWDYLQAVADSGVYMGFDQISKEKYYPDSRRIETIRKLIETGHGHQILLSGDMARKSYWPSYGFGRGPGLTYILWRFVPWMMEEGISREAVDEMLVHNPARLFAWA
jgi:5-phospho-D-xylono-1,4-lactonase